MSASILRVCLISGKGPTKDANGLEELAGRIKEKFGVTSRLARYDEPIVGSFDVIIGHSYGGNRAIEIANAQASTSYVGLIDPVAIGWFPFFFWVPGQHFMIPSGVKKAECFQRHSNFLPPSSKILNSNGFSKINYVIEMTHADAPRHFFVQDHILDSMEIYMEKKEKTS